MTSEQHFPYVGMTDEHLGAPSVFMPVADTPLRNPFDPATIAQYRRDEQRRQQLHAADRAMAERQWTRLREAVAGNPIAVAVLNLHQPESDGYQVCCSECWEVEGYESGGHAAWPCDTYNVVKASAS